MEGIFNKDLEIQLIDIILNNFSQESLEYLFDKLKVHYSQDYKYRQFILLNEKAHKIIDILVNHKDELGRNIWDIAWKRIYQSNIYNIANQIYSINYERSPLLNSELNVFHLMKKFDQCANIVQGLLKEEELFKDL